MRLFHLVASVLFLGIVGCAAKQPLEQTQSEAASAPSKGSPVNQATQSGSASGGGLTYVNSVPSKLGSASSILGYLGVAQPAELIRALVPKEEQRRFLSPTQFQPKLPAIVFIFGPKAGIEKFDDSPEKMLKQWNLAFFLPFQPNSDIANKLFERIGTEFPQKKLVPFQASLEPGSPEGIMLVLDDESASIMESQRTSMQSVIHSVATENSYPSIVLHTDVNIIYERFSKQIEEAIIKYVRKDITKARTLRYPEEQELASKVESLYTKKYMKEISQIQAIDLRFDLTSELAQLSFSIQNRSDAPFEQFQETSVGNLLERLPENSVFRAQINVGFPLQLSWLSELEKLQSQTQDEGLRRWLLRLERWTFLPKAWAPLVEGMSMGAALGFTEKEATFHGILHPKDPEAMMSQLIQTIQDPKLQSLKDPVNWLLKSLNIAYIRIQDASAGGSVKPLFYSDIKETIDRIKEKERWLRKERKMDAALKQKIVTHPSTLFITRKNDEIFISYSTKDPKNWTTPWAFGKQSIGKSLDSPRSPSQSGWFYGDFSLLNFVRSGGDLTPIRFFIASLPEEFTRLTFHTSQNVQTKTAAMMIRIPRQLLNALIHKDPSGALDE